MTTFGNTHTGEPAHYNEAWDDQKYVGRFQAGATGTISKLTVILRNTNAGHMPCHVKGVIYTDKAGPLPDAFLTNAVSNEVAVTDNMATSAKDLTFATPPSVVSGNYYWLGIIGCAHSASDTCVGLALGDDGVGTGAAYYNADTYSDGPSASFGTGSGQTMNLCVYATYVDVSVTGTGAVTAGSSLFGTGTVAQHVTSNLTGLTPGMHYYVRFYGANPDGTGYGSEVEFTAAVDSVTGGVATGPAKVSGTGTVVVLGTGGVSIGAVKTGGIGISGGQSMNGNGTLRLGPVQMYGSGSVEFHGSGAVTTSTAALSGSGSVAHDTCTGTGAIATASVSISGIGNLMPEEDIGVGDVTTGAAAVSGSGIVLVLGTGAVTTHAGALLGSGVLDVTGTGALTVSSVKVGGFGTTGITVVGSGTLLVGSPKVSGTAKLVNGPPGKAKKHHCGWTTGVVSTVKRSLLGSTTSD